MAKNIKRDYWRDRFLKEELRQNALSVDEIDKIHKLYDKAIFDIDRDMNYWLSKIVNNENITINDLKVKLSQGEMKKFRLTLDEYIAKGKQLDLDPALIKELENASALYHVDRLEAIKLQTKWHLDNLANSKNESLEQFLKETYTESYYRSVFEIQQAFKFGNKIYALNDNLLDNIIKRPWTADNFNFSARIWRDKDLLVARLQETLVSNAIQGESIVKISKEFAEKMNVDLSKAVTLIRTESNAFHSLSRQQVYNDLDVEQYEIVAVLDNKTSETCQSLDGKIFKQTEYQVGVTANPFHICCRSTTAPYFEDSNDYRVARNEKGRIYEVTASMKYEEWKKEFVLKK